MESKEIYEYSVKNNLNYNEYLILLENNSLKIVKNISDHEIKLSILKRNNTNKENLMEKL